MNEPRATAPVGDASPTAERTHRWGFGAFFLAEAVFLLVSATLPAVVGDRSQAGPNAGFALTATMVLPTVLAAVVAVLITVVRGNGPRVDFGLRWRWSDVRTGVAIGALGLISTVIATQLWIRWVGPENATSTVSGAISEVRLPLPLAVLIFLHIWLVAPLCEELLYRGLLWGAMERLRWGQIAVFVLSTAIFAIGHLEPERTWLLLVIAVPIGVARMMTGRLTASVVAHQVNNFLPALAVLLVSLGLVPG